MKIKSNRLAATGLGLAVAATAAIGLAAGPASAATAKLVMLTGPNNVGDYAFPNTADGKVGADLFYKDDVGVFAVCYENGQAVVSGHPQWYKINGEYLGYDQGETVAASGWVYGYYVDHDNAVGSLPGC